MFWIGLIIGVWCTFQYNNDYGLRTQKTRRKVKCVETGIIWAMIDGLKK